MQANKIEMHKKYRTRSGLPVRILCVDCDYPDFPVVALVRNRDNEECILCTTSHGIHQLESPQHPFDLVEVSEWDDFKVDDKVLVSEDGKTWYKRYFNKVIEGVPYAFDGGTTSWTAGVLHDYGCSSPWKFCKKAEV